MIYPSYFEEKSGFGIIRELLTQKCLSGLGKEFVSQMSLMVHVEEIIELLLQTEEMKKICQFDDQFPVNNYVDVRPSLEKAKVEGIFLEEHEFHDIRRSLETIKAILGFIKKKEEIEFPALKKLSSEVQFFPFVIEKINHILNPLGKVKDNASKELQVIRKEIVAKNSQVSKRIHQLLKAAQAEGIVEMDATIAIRDGRAVIPISAANKRKIKGYIHDESATGKTAYIEPAEIVELNNEIKEHEYEERREITRILTHLTNDIRPYLSELKDIYHFLGHIDFTRAKALFAIETNALKPIIRKEQAFHWKNAIHPLLYLTLKKEKKEVVPLDIWLTNEKRILLISGPNAGGKSVCLKTTGLLQYMLQCGLLVPMEEDSTCTLFTNIFMSIGDEQSIENDLSTYSSHLINLNYFAKHADSETMILIDEFGSGTDPLLGGAIAEAFLEEFIACRSFGVITTHYSNLKQFATNSNGILNGAMLYDNHRMQALYKLDIGKPGSSFAFEIARKIGIPEHILQRASEKAGKGHVIYEKTLKDIARDKRYWEEKRQKVRVGEKKLEELINRYTEELESAQRQRKRILEKATNEANNIINNANKKIENTIRVIKETQAEKEKTKEAREKLHHFKEELNNIENSEDKRVAHQLRKLKEKNKHKETAIPENTENTEKTGIITFIPGNKVKLKGQTTAGSVIEISGKQVLVEFGSMISKIDPERLEQITEEEYTKLTGEKKQSGARGYNLLQSRMDFKTDIDIRGKRADEAIQIVRRLIDEAIMLSITRLRVLHGKGNGILRQLIREYLSTEQVIKSYRDEQEQFGGSGITVIELDL